MCKRIAILFLLAAFSMFAQLDSNSVTVTATRNVTLTADQAVFGVYVDTDTTTTLNDVVAALHGSGITLASFVSVYTTQQYDARGFPSQLGLRWSFGLPSSISKLKDTTTALSSLQQTVQKNTKYKLSFTLQGTQVSQQLQQSQPCVVPSLISDARAQAQKLADAGGLSVGAILAMSSSTATTTSAGGSSSGTSFSSFLLSSPSFFPSACSVTVKFALGRF